MAVLTNATLADAVAELRRRDEALDRVVSRHGVPPLWARRPGFATLVQIVLEQQVSLASGRAAYARLVAVAGDPSPARIAALGSTRLRSAGLTRQKAAYIHELARAVVRGDFDTRALSRMSDADAMAALVALRGVGPWTAHVYLLMALRRADAWPSGDLALAIAAREVMRLRAVPSALELDRLGERWRPWRAAAARILWAHYLGTERPRPTGR